MARSNALRAQAQANIDSRIQNTEPFTTGEDFAAMFGDSTGSSKPLEGSLVKGIIVGLDDDAVTVDVGLKSEGRISLKEFSSLGDEPELNIGDEVEVFLERMENRQGEIVLSREKALREQAWERLEKDMTGQKQVDGIIFGQVKGGFTVDLGGAVAFLPGSQVDVRPIKDISSLANSKQKFLVLKMDKKRGNIIVSRRAILEESRAEAREEMLKGVKVNDIMDGTVKNLTNYGAFIDLGGLDGLLHVTDISWKRISHPSEVLKLGQSVKVQVIKFDDETKRISLGMKQLEENPWGGVADKFPVGKVATGRVSNIADYGVFIDLGDGVEGLVHVSELSWVKKNQNPNKLVKVGDEVKVKVLEIDSEKRRISLGMKQTEENPWSQFATNNKEGDTIEGEIKNISDFGFFVGLEGGIDGLVHYSDLSWDKPGEEALKDYKKGDAVKAVILSVDIEKERIGLGVKQLSGGGAAGEQVVEQLNNLKKGDTVTCTVQAVQRDGIEVVVGETPIVSFIKRNDLSKDRSEQRPDRFAVGDRVDAKIISVNAKKSQIGVSIKTLEVDEHKQAIEQYGSTDSGASLGDILGKALEKGKK